MKKATFAEAANYKQIIEISIPPLGGIANGRLEKEL